MNKSCQLSQGSGTKTTLDVQTFRANFPIFSNHPDLIYLDSASTTQKPQAVKHSLSAYRSLYILNTRKVKNFLTKNKKKQYVKIAWKNPDMQRISFNAGFTLTFLLVASSSQAKMCPERLASPPMQAHWPAGAAILGA